MSSEEFTEQWAYDVIDMEDQAAREERDQDA